MRLSGVSCLLIQAPEMCFGLDLYKHNIFVALALA